MSRYLCGASTVSPSHSRLCGVKEASRTRRTAAKRPRFPRLLMLGSLMVGLSGCETYFSMVPDVPSSLPTTPVRPYAASNTCIGAQVTAYARSTNRRFVAIIDELGDKTLRPGTPLSGDLSNAGGEILRGVMRNHTAADAVPMPLVTPLAMRLAFSGAELDSRSLQRLVQETGSRPTDLIIAITGGFTAFDRARSGDGTGTAGNFKSGEVGVSTEAGRASEAARMELTLHMGTLAPNRHLATIVISATSRRTSANYRLEGRVYGLGLGLQQKDIIADGVQAVQANMLEAAHWMIWDRLLPATWPRNCTDGRRPDPGHVVDAAREYYGLSREDKTRRLQQLLNRFLGGRESVAVTGRITPGIWRHIRRLEAVLDLPPASEGDLDSLYLHALPRFPEPGPNHRQPYVGLTARPTTPAPTAR